MNYLLIDTTTSYVTVSIIKNYKIIQLFHKQIVSDMSSKILPILDEELSNSNMSLKDINKIFVTDGPGSFTGVRIGVAIAKTIAWALNIPIITLSSLELMATTNTDKKYLVPMIDARRGNVFAGIYDSRLNCVKKDKLVNLKELIQGTDNGYLFVSYDEICIDEITKPEIDIIKIIKKHENDVSTNPHKVNPNYLKLTEAEESRKNN